METNAIIKKALLLGTLIVFLLAVGFFITKNSGLKNQLADEKLKSEMLLSAKLSLDKSVTKMTKDMYDLKGKNSQLDKKIIEANEKILQKNNHIEKLLAENASAKAIGQKNKELEILIQQLNKDITNLNNSLATAKSDYLNLSEKLASSEKAKSDLSSDNSVLKAMISDNYRTEALRGKKDKLTVNARRTNKLQLSFDLPGYNEKDVYFRIITPDGKEYSSETDNAITINIKENGDGLLASSNPKEFGGYGTKRVEMTFKPKEKLQDGIYQFNMYNEGRFIGSTLLRLK